MSKPMKPSKKNGGMLGIQIVPKAYSKEPNHIYFKVHFKVAKGSYAPLFHTNRRLRDLLEKHPILHGKEIGFIGFGSDIDAANKKETFMATFPFNKLGEYGVDSSLFEGTGLATDLERKTLIEIKKRYGSDVLLKPLYGSTLESRRKQLGARGIKMGRGGTYKTSVANMIRGIDIARRQWAKRYGR